MLYKKIKSWHLEIKIAKKRCFAMAIGAIAKEKVTRDERSLHLNKLLNYLTLEVLFHLLRYLLR